MNRNKTVSNSYTESNTYSLMNILSVRYQPLYFIDFRFRCETMVVHKLREVGVTKGYKQTKKNFVKYSLKRDE